MIIDQQILILKIKKTHASGKKNLHATKYIRDKKQGSKLNLCKRRN